ncbi:collagen-like protein [Rummeliibacillus sp. G93]|uniref:collagen-like protein n=1 Tax=Rummeliibacillus TaxID=648802 RepID=UPI0011BF0558|nr:MULTISPECIES: collagen-like protein [Rummeliibacillus]UQW97287.1 collagen-like protein [Rummeliibacillus sp. G93]
MNNPFQFPSFPGSSGMPSFPGSSFPGIPGIPSSPGPSFPGTPGTSQAPTAPPPSFTPQQSTTVSPLAVDPGAIRMCLFRNTYVWLNNGDAFWYYPVFVGSRSVSGFRWTGWTWVIFGIDTRRISSFTCF